MDNKAKNDDGSHGDVKPPREGKDFAKDANSKHSKGDYTEKIWNKINKSVSEDKMSELKSQVQGVAPGDINKKRKRRRKKKKFEQVGPVENESKGPQVEVVSGSGFEPMHEPGQVEVRSEVVVEPVPEVVPEPVAEVIPEPEPLPPPPPPVVPINPFAQGQDVVADSKPAIESFDFSPGDDFKVVNPFDPTPLEEVREEKSAEDRGDSVESETENPFAAHAGVVEESREGEKPESVRDVETPNTEIIDLNPEPVLNQQANNEVLEVDEFKDEFWHILEQAGISKKGVVVFSLIFVFGIFGLLVYLFGWYKIFDFSGGEKRVEIVAEVESEKDSVKADESSNGGSIAGVVSSFIFGLEYALPAQPIVVKPIGAASNIIGIDVALLIGRNDELSEVLFVSYVDLLGRMENIYNIDIYELVNLSVDRRAALEDYLSQMDAMINDGLIALAKIESDLVSIGIEYDARNAEKSQYELLFFNNTQAFYGQTAYDNLQLFVESDKAAVELKARYSAYDTLRTLFINSLNLLRPRYKDISINSEALIKGIKIFDVPKSDIDAVLPAP